MPNWCENRLQVSGDSKQLDEFIKKAKSKETDLTLNNFFPTPPELLECQSPNDKNPEAMIKKYGYPDWYEWQIANWGVKWDTHEVRVSREKKKTAFFDFDSPWGPPSVFIKRVAKLYPKLKFVLEYSEPGMFFSGDLIITKGKVTQDDHREGTVWPEHQVEDEEE